jgi:hypothetical protein
LWAKVPPPAPVPMMITLGDHPAVVAAVADLEVA